MSKPYEPPLIISHPEDGFLRVGKETNDDIDRKTQVELGSGSGASLFLFDDGGWEIRGIKGGLNDTADSEHSGANIIQQGGGPLNIISEGDLNINVDGTFSVKAKNIVMDAEDRDGDFVLIAERNIRLNAKNNLTMIGTNVVTKASQTLLAHSDGFNIMSSDTRDIVYESKTPMTPTSITKMIKTLLSNITYEDN